MPDITKCKGESDGVTCLLREKCYRFTATPDGVRQSWFIGIPLKTDGECDSFWPNTPATEAFAALRKAANGRFDHIEDVDAYCRELRYGDAEP